jgi:hypothetical protein
MDETPVVNLLRWFEMNASMSAAGTRRTDPARSAAPAHAKISSITPRGLSSLIGREQFPVRPFQFPVLLGKIPCSTA